MGDMRALNSAGSARPGLVVASRHEDSIARLNAQRYAAQLPAIPERLMSTKFSSANEIVTRLKRAGQCVVAIVLLLGLLSLPVSLSRASSHSLFGRSPRFANLDTFYSNLLLTPDDRYLIFVADLETADVFYIYRVPIEGGQPVRLSDVIQPGALFSTIQLTPDGSRVVYMARYELFSVPVAGGPVVKLNRQLPVGGSIDSFRINANGDTVVYVGSQDTKYVSELYSVPVTGGTPVKLNAPLVAFGDVDRLFAISPNDQYVVYWADHAVDDRPELYCVPIHGGAVQQLNIDLGVGGRVASFHIDPAFNAVIYTARLNSTAPYELYSAFLSGAQIAKLNGALPLGKNVTRTDIANDGYAVVYEVGDDSTSTLYAVQLGGGISTPLSPAGIVDQPRISDDSKYATFRFQTNTAAAWTLYTAALATGTRATLYSFAQGHSMVDATASSDLAWYIFSDADIAQQTTSKLIAAPLQAGTFVQLSADSEQASKPLISPRNDRVLYASRSSDIACPETNLVSVPIAGGEPRRLSAQCGTGGSVTQFLWSSSGAQAVYLVTYQDAQGKSAGFELFSSDGQAILPTPSPDASEVWLPLVQHAVLPHLRHRYVTRSEIGREGLAALAGRRPGRRRWASQRDGPGHLARSSDCCCSSRGTEHPRLRPTRIRDSPVQARQTRCASRARGEPSARGAQTLARRIP
jgi:hypothetical protein